MVSSERCGASERRRLRLYRRRLGKLPCSFFWIANQTRGGGGRAGSKPPANMQLQAEARPRSRCWQIRISGERSSRWYFKHTHLMHLLATIPCEISSRMNEARVLEVNRLEDAAALVRPTVMEVVMWYGAGACGADVTTGKLRALPVSWEGASRTRARNVWRAWTFVSFNQRREVHEGMLTGLETWADTFVQHMRSLTVSSRIQAYTSSRSTPTQKIWCGRYVGEGFTLTAPR
jgi:hypothetical protein